MLAVRASTPGGGAAVARFPRRGRSRRLCDSLRLSRHVGHRYPLRERRVAEVHQRMGAASLYWIGILAYGMLISLLLGLALRPRGKSVSRSTVDEHRAVPDFSADPLAPEIVRARRIVAVRKRAPRRSRGCASSSGPSDDPAATSAQRLGMSAASASEPSTTDDVRNRFSLGRKARPSREN